MGDVERKNVVVVGAGASKEFGLPTGWELKKKIAHIADIRFDDWGNKLVSGDYRLVETLRLIARDSDNGYVDINPYLHEARRIRDNMQLAPSIDNYLDTHRENDKLVKFGKLAIVKSILQAESESLLALDERNRHAQLDFANLDETWLAKLFQLLVAQRDFPSFLQALESITFVSFNYDRCIYQFFLVAAQTYFNIQRDDLEKVHSALNVLYPYGSVGNSIPSDLGFGVRGFGAEVHGDELIDRAANIRTFTEGAASDRIREIHASFEEADVVMFLGFGFLKLNMELLFGGKEFECDIVLATTKGLSSNSVKSLQNELREVFFAPGGRLVGGPLSDEHLQLMDVTCGQLIFEFHRLLSAS